jgi:hypothetical protein
VHLLDAWAALPAPDFLRMAFPVALLVLAVLMPGRSAARFSALGVAGVARLDLESELTRRSSYGVLLVSLGFLHLMLRRHAARAAAAFAAMGLGLQVLQGVVRRVVTASGPPAPALPLLATALAVALALRVASVRESALGSSWVSDAHDLHD